jgi:hypothetical protein
MLQSLTPDLRHLTISYKPQRRIVSQDKIKERFTELMNRYRNREVQGNDEEKNSGNDPLASDEDGADDDDQDTARDKRRRARMDTSVQRLLDIVNNGTVEARLKKMED